MKPDEKKLELRVGFFVMAGVVLAAGAILMLGGKQSLFARKNTYTSHFAKVDGLVSGAKVVLGGLNIGVLKSVDFDAQTRDIIAQYSVEKKYEEFIRKDSSVEIVTQGVLGDKYLSIIPGNPSEPIIEDGGEIPIGGTKDLSQLFSSSEKLMQKLTSTAENLDRILTSFNKGNRSDQFFEGLSTTSKNMGQLTKKLNDEVTEMKLKSSINHLNSILEKIDHGSGTVGALINDPALYDDAKALVGQVNRNRIMRNLIRQTIRDNKEKALENDNKE
ncbi:MAG: MCE family protein [Bdellovibrionales bacterium]|nr:MCE family protein [Bdellovibrionales bacterium]